MSSFRTLDSVGVIYLVLLTFVAAQISTEETTIRIKAGGEAVLPCDISIPKERNDANSLQVILWFKDEASTPVYTVDARETGIFWNGSHGRPTEDKRLTMTSNPTALRISNVRTQDGGVYRCRVDFRYYPTRNSRVKLEVF